MDEILSLLGIAGAIAVGAVSPGPSFLLVARTSVAESRAAGVAVAFGIGLAGALYTIVALAGLQAVFMAIPGVYLSLKLVGGLYLVYLGYQLWKGSRQSLAMPSDSGESDQPNARHAFLTGLGTQLSNPKAAIYYASVFAVFQPENFSLILGVCTVLIIFMIEVGWYLVVSLTLSSAKPRAAYLRYKTWIDRSSGGIMAILGIKLISSAN